MENYKITTLNDFIILKQKDFSYAKGELSSLLHHIGTAAISALLSSGECCGVVTEENQNEIVFSETFASKGKYIVCIDPLDGSSNIDYNVSVGTIFSIYRRKMKNPTDHTHQDT